MIIGGKPTNPGDLRTRITLYRRTVETQPGGFQVAGLEEIASVWSKWVNAHGREAWEVSSLQAQVNATAFIRYLDGVDETCLVGLGEDQLFEIVSIDNIRQVGEYMELRLKQVRPG
jgi:SPP1 family predicted phage head-tail adaptor